MRQENLIFDFYDGSKRKIRVLEQSLAKTAEPVVTKATTATTTPTTTPTTTVSTASVKTKASKN